MRTGGVSTLGYLIDCEPVKNFVDNILQNLVENKNLSKNKQIMYFCLIEALNYYDFNNELDYITDFMNINEKYLFELRKKLVKDFP